MSHRYGGIALVFIAGFQVACGGDNTAPSQDDRKVLISPPSSPIGNVGARERPIELELDSAHQNECSVVKYNPGENPAGFSRSTVRIPGFAQPAAGAVPDMALGHLRYVRWDRQTKTKVMEVLCVIPRTAHATRNAKMFLASLDRGPLTLPAQGPLLVAGDIPEGNQWGIHS